MIGRLFKLLFLATLYRSVVSTGGMLRKEPPETPINEEESQDVQLGLIAKMLKCTRAEAESHLALQEEFSNLVAKLEDHPGFSGSAMALNPGDDVSIYFKDGVPSDLVQDVEDFAKKTNANVNKVSTKYSRKEQEERAERIAAILLRRNGATEVAYGLGPGDELEIMAVVPEEGEQEEDELEEGADTRTIEMDVDMYAPHETREEMDKLVKAVLGKEAEADELEGVQLTVIPEGQLTEPMHTYGGRQLGYCTTGFSVINVLSGETGVATAGHCTTTRPLYDAVEPESDYRTTFRADHMGLWGDLEWHITPGHWDLPEFYANPTLKWPVSSIAQSFSINDLVCVHSERRERAFCDRVRRVGVRIEYPGYPPMYKMVEMYGNNNIPGDSGGPWFSGTKAAGIVSGIWHGKAVFTPVKNLPRALGVAVRVKGQKTFSRPRLYGENRVDWCKYWSKDCGKPAADAFCRSEGYTRAGQYAIDYNIGLTRVIGTNKICNASFCDGFKYIQCTS